MILICLPVSEILMTFLATGFQASDLDESGDLITCLDAISSHPFFKTVKEESYRLLQLNAGSRVLDLGCGTGGDAWNLASLAGPDGLVAAVDPGITMLREARLTGSRNELSPCQERAPSFIQMDGRSLGFVDGIFDAVREDRALQHIAHPELVVQELIRVLKPGGRFVLFEPDWELFTIDNSARNLTRSILNYWADQFMNGWIGRELYRICTNSGACEVTILPRTMILHDLRICDQIFSIRETVSRACDAGVIPKNEGLQWLHELEDADRNGTFFSSFTGYLIAGKKG